VCTYQSDVNWDEDNAAPEGAEQKQLPACRYRDEHIWCCALVVVRTRLHSIFSKVSNCHAYQSAGLAGT